MYFSPIATPRSQLSSLGKILDTPLRSFIIIIELDQQKKILNYKPLLPTYIIYLFQRDGCPKIVNLGSSKTDLFYERKKYGFKRR